MSIRKLRAGRVPGVTASQYVGVQGTIFWDEPTGQLRLSDGDTPGGKVLNPAVAASSTTPPLNPYEGELWYDPTSKELWAYHNGAFAGTINLATETVLGGVRLGPGVTTNENGQIIIDPAGLEFSFGDFSSTVGTKSDNVTTYAVLSSINPNEDIVIASNGTGDVSIVGEFSVHATNGALNETLENIPAFKIKADGQVKMLVPVIDNTDGAVSIVGSSTGAFVSPVNTGVMLHITGQYASPAIPSRVYNDAQNSFAAFVARRFNGTVASPTAVLDGEEIMRISGTAHDGTVIPGAGNTRIVYKVLGNQTLTNHGGAIEFWTTPQNSITLTKVASVDDVNGITSTKFTGPLTGDVTGNASGNAGTVTNGVYTTDTGTVTNTMLAGSIANNKLSNSGITVNGSTIALGGTATITAAAGTLTGTTLNSTVVTSSLTSVGTLGSLNVTNTVTAGLFDGINKRTVRSVGTVADGGTVTINFATDDVVEFTWGNGVNLAYSNYTAGRLVKVIAKKATGTGTDSISLGGLTAANVSSGTTSIAGNADNTYFIELICTNTSIGSVYAKV